MNKKQWANGILGLMMLAAFVYGLSRVADAPDIVSLFNPEVRVSSAAAALEEKVTLERYDLNINQVTKQVTAVFEISNKARSTVSDISIVCDFYDNDGGSWGRGRWNIYAALSPSHGVETYVVTDRRYISYRARAELSRCRIVDFKYPEEVTTSDAGGH